MYFQLTTRFISESNPDASGPFPTANIRQTYPSTGVAADQGVYELTYREEQNARCIVKGDELHV